jgi:hypothetical protein
MSLFSITSSHLSSFVSILFLLQFLQFAVTLEDSIEFHLKGVVQATQGLSQVLTSEAIKKNETWPFVTLSSFEVYVGNTRAQSSSELIVVAPFVEKGNLEPWTKYSTAPEQQRWIDESFDIVGGRIDPSPIPSIYRFGRYKGRTVLVSEDGEGTNYPAAPFWQISPPPFDTSIVNFNSLSTETYQEVYDAMMTTRHFVFGKAGANDLIDYTISQEAHDALHTTLIEQHHHEHNNSNSNNNNDTVPATGFANAHPHTPLIYPVFRDLGGGDDTDVVAMVVNILPWDNFFKGALPPGVNGIHAILTNSHGQVFTYLVNGHNAKYLGAGDQHDTAFDSFVYRIDIDAIVGGATNANITTTNLNRYFLAVYPSQELKAEYNSNLPLIFALVSGCGFILMALTFLLYDWMVIRKNKKIMDTAARSNAILSVRQTNNRIRRIITHLLSL